VIDRDALLTQLADELPAQRWFGASSVAGIDVVRELPEKLVQVIVRGDDGGRYQTVLGVRDDGSIVDATTDSNLSLALFHQTMPDEDVAKVRPLGAEQSNTSLVFDERIVLKLFHTAQTDPPSWKVYDTEQRVIVVRIDYQPEVRQGVFDFLPLEKTHTAVYPVRQGGIKQGMLQHPGLRIGTVKQGYLR